MSEPNIFMQALAWNKPDSKQAKLQNYTWFRESTQFWKASLGLKQAKLQNYTLFCEYTQILKASLGLKQVKLQNYT